MATVTSSKRHLLVTSDTYTSNGDVTVGGDLFVNGSQTVINTATLNVEDKNISLNYGGTEASSQGSGITIVGSGATLIWDEANTRWAFSDSLVVTDHVKMASGNASGKFAVKSTDVHASYDFYNNGTSYFNDAVVIDANLTLSGGVDILMSDNSGAAVEFKQGTELYMRFITTNGGEHIEVNKNMEIQGLTATAGTFSSTLSASNLSGTNTGDQDLSGLLPKSGGTITGDITLDDGSGASPSIYFKNGDDNYWRIFNGSNLDLTFRVGTVTKFDIDSSGNGTFVGGLTLSGSVDSGATDYGYYQSAGTNIILKGDSVGRSGIFFESEKDGTNINDPSDYGFIQFHSYGYDNTGGEANNLVIGVANDSTDKVILQAPYNGGVMVGYKDATSGTGLTLSEVIHTNSSSYNNSNWDTAYTHSQATNIHIDWTTDQGSTNIHANNLPTQSQYLRSNANDTATGNLIFNGDVTFGGTSSAPKEVIIAQIAEDTSESTSLMIDGNGVVKTRNLGDAAFVSTSDFITTSGGQTITSGGNIGLTIKHDDFNEGLVIHRNHANNSPSITFKNNDEQIGILFGQESDDNIYWRQGTNATNYKIFHSGNDGSGSGLDADKLDGQNGSYYTNADNLSSGTIPSARFPDNIFDSYRRSSINSSSHDFNTYLTTGTYHVENWSDTNDVVANGPTGSYAWGVLRVTNWQSTTGSSSGTGTYVLQEYFPHNTDTCWTRIMWNGSFTSWRESWGSGSDGAGSGLDADKLDGQHGSYFLNTSSTAQTKSGDLTADQFIATNNGNGQNFRIGDDVWIGDINLANTFRVQGNQDTTKGYITFGSTSNTQLGRSGSGALTWGGDKIWHAGNDGPTSGLNADLLDDKHAADFASVNHNHDSRYVRVDVNQTLNKAYNFSNTGNQFNGHLYFNAYDANGSHYPHFRAGSNANGTTINFRQYYNATSYINHVWKATNASDAYFDFVGELRPNKISCDGNISAIGDLIAGSATDGAQRVLRLYSYNTDSKHAVIKCSDGNLHVDSEDGHALYLNYYDGASTNIYFGTGNSGYCGTVSSSGLLRMANDVVAYYSFSDRRLKTNIKTTENNLEKILSLNPVEYTWKEGPREGVKEIGLIAQEVEEVVPEVVRTQSRHHDEITEGVDYKQVDYEHLVSTLIGAVQEQQKQIDELKEKMAACEARSCKCK